jgi:photosystem II stability/assembly factor-like uncharacterized protein
MIGVRTRSGRERDARVGLAGFLAPNGSIAAGGVVMTRSIIAAALFVFLLAGHAGARPPSILDDHSPAAVLMRADAGAVLPQGGRDGGMSLQGAGFHSPYGPFGGYIQCFAEAPDGSLVFATTLGGGIFRSHDRGVSWEPSWDGVLDIDVRTVAIDPLDPRIAYCGTFAAGLYRTTDGGDTWTPAGNGLGGFGLGPTVHLLVCDPTNGDVYCCPLGRGLFRTTNHGDLWEPVGEGTELPLLLNDLAIDPVSPDNLLAGDRNVGIFRSTDHGVTWADVNQDFGGFTPFVQSLAFAPSDPSRVFCAFFAHTTGAGGGIWTSTDGGVRWASANNGIPSYLNFGLHSVSIRRDLASTIYVSTLASTQAGVFRSTDSGASWTRQVQGLTDVNVNTVLCSGPAPQRIYSGGGYYLGGVFISADGGLSWQERNEGLTGQRIYDIVRSGGDLFVAARGAIFRMRAGETRFTYCVEGLPEVNSKNTVYATLSADPFSPSTLVAGNILLYRDGIFKTTDSGDHWFVAGAGNPAFYTTKNDVLFDPLVPDRLYAGTYNNGMFRSTDGGATFQQVNNGLTNLGVTVIGIDPIAPNTVYGGTQGGGVYKSVNGGDSWAQRNGGIADPAPEIIDLVIDSSQPQNLYASNLQNLAASLYKTTNGASSWFSIVNDLPSPASMLTLDAANMQTVYVVGEDLRTYRSTNGGTQWHLFTGDLYYTRCYSDPAPSHDLWATAIGCGVFRLGATSAVGEDHSGQQPSAGGLSVFPSPFDQRVRIEIDGTRGFPAGGLVRIFDVCGRLVRAFPPLSEGTRAIDWDGRDANGAPVAAGVYPCLVEGMDGRHTARLIRLRY